MSWQLRFYNSMKATIGFGQVVMWRSGTGRWVFQWQFRGYAHEVHVCELSGMLAATPQHYGRMYGRLVREEYRQGAWK